MDSPCRTIQLLPSFGASMAARSGQLVAQQAGGKNDDPDEPEDHALGALTRGLGHESAHPM